jgi:hypothetical protein
LIPKHHHQYNKKTTRDKNLSSDQTNDQPSKSRHAKNRSDPPMSRPQSENEQEGEKITYSDDNDYTNIETPRVCDINNTISPLE